MDMDGDGDLSESKALLSTIGSDAAAAAEGRWEGGEGVSRVRSKLAHPFWAEFGGQA